jgi:hypothetical protein
MAGPYLLPVRWRRVIVPVVALAVACAVIFAVTAYHDWQTAHLILRAQNVIPPRADQEPRVQVMANIFVQNPVNDIDGQVKAQEHARQVLYETAGKECETLRATIAKECQLESINVNVNVNPNVGRGRPPDGFMVNSTFVFVSLRT